MAMIVRAGAHPDVLNGSVDFAWQLGIQMIGLNLVTKTFRQIFVMIVG